MRERTSRSASGSDSSMKRSSGALMRGSENTILILKNIQTMSEVLEGYVKHINSNKSAPRN
jgi:hypothetical protein